MNGTIFYHHLYHKEYESFGYRWQDKELPSWIKVSIEENGDSKCLIVYSDIHKNKRVEMTPTYSNKFTDLEIIKDLSGKIAAAFL